MKASPLPHQLPAIQRHAEVLSKHNASLEASVPGFGKTYVAAFLAMYLGLTPAILCPKSVLPHWYEAMGNCGVKPLFVTNYEQAKLDKFKHGEWVIKGRKYEWQLPEKTLLVFDEGHRCADRTTQNSKMMTATRAAGVEYGLKTLVMSATAAKDPLDLYALGYILGLHQGVDFMGWCMARGVRRGAFCFEFRGGQPALDQLHHELFPAHGYRARYADLPDFPASTVEALPVEVEHPEEVDEMFAKVAELEMLQGEASEAIVARLRARQKTELLKVPVFLELIKDGLREGQSVALFLNFRESIDAVLSKLKSASVVVGGQSAEVRQEQIDLFQSDRHRVIVCQAQAGGVGISLHDMHGNYPRLSLISPPESARSLIQILGRIHRTGAKSPALQKLVFAENTVESRVRRTVEKNVKQIDTLNDGQLDPTQT